MTFRGQNIGSLSGIPSHYKPLKLDTLKHYSIITTKILRIVQIYRTYLDSTCNGLPIVIYI